MNFHSSSRKNDETPLIQAAKKGDASAVRNALSQADANARDAQGWTALMHAAWHRRADCVQALLTHADASLIAGANAWSALMFAVAGDDAQCARLIAEKSDCSIRNADGKTALEMGVDLGAWECVAEIAATLPAEDQAVALKRWGSQNLPRLHAQIEARALAAAAGLDDADCPNEAKRPAQAQGHAGAGRGPRSL